MAHNPSNYLGSDRLANPMSWGSVLTAFPKQPSLLVGRGTFFRYHLPIWPQGSHGMILGPTRSGKSSTFILPNLLLAAEKARTAKTDKLLPSFVVSDPKAELLAKSGPSLKAAGYDVRVFAPGVPSLSQGYDLLPWARQPNGRLDYSAVKEMMEAILPVPPKIADPFWVRSGQLLLMASIVTAARMPEANFAHVLALLYSDPQVALNTARQTDKWASANLNALLTALGHNPKAFGSVLAEIPAHLSNWTTPEMLEIFSGQPWNWSSVWERPTAVFVIARETEAAIQSSFWGHLLAEIRRGPAMLPRPLVLLLDEFGNIGAIPGFSEAVTMTAGKGVSIWVGVQSLGQFKAYEDKASTVQGNLVNRIVYPGLDYDTAKAISDALGVKTVRVQSHSQSMTTQGNSLQTLYQRREVMTPGEVSRLWYAGYGPPPILFHRLGRFAHKLGTCPYYLDRRFKDASRGTQEERLAPWRHEVSDSMDLAEMLAGLPLPKPPREPEPPQADAGPQLPDEPEPPPEAEDGAGAEDGPIKIDIDDIFGGR